MKHAIAAVLILAVISGCGKASYPQEWGKRIAYGNSSVFYTSSVEESKARELGDYLAKNGFFPKEKSGLVQINREGGTYQFRIVVKEGVEKDMEYMKNVGLFSAILSRDIFGGANIETHLCDRKFKTLQVIAFKIEEEK